MGCTITACSAQLKRSPKQLPREIVIFRDYLSIGKNPSTPPGQVRPVESARKPAQPAWGRDGDQAQVLPDGLDFRLGFSAGGTGKAKFLLAQYRHHADSSVFPPVHRRQRSDQTARANGLAHH
jgi:hypothetical protein